MQILPLADNRAQLRARTINADLAAFKDYCHQRIKAAQTPSYEEHNAGGRRPLRTVTGRLIRAGLNLQRLSR